MLDKMFQKIKKWKLKRHYNKQISKAFGINFFTKLKPSYILESRKVSRMNKLYLQYFDRGVKEHQDYIQKLIDEKKCLKK